MHVNSSLVTQEVVNRLGLQTDSANLKSFQSDSKIVPVLEVNPNVVRTINLVLSSGASATGTMTISLPTKGTIWLFGLQLSYIKDATCDAAIGGILVQGYYEGSQAQTNLLMGSMLTTTAQADSIVVMFPTPLKMQANTAITQTVSYTAGLMRRGLVLYLCQE